MIMKGSCGESTGLGPRLANGAAAMISIRSTRRLHRRSPRRGVSLVELLVVLAIMLLIFAMAGVLIGPPLRKARLAAAANDLAVLASGPPIEARTQARGAGAVHLPARRPRRTGPSSWSRTRVDAIAAAPGAPDGRLPGSDRGGTDPDSSITAIQPVSLPEGIVFTDLPAPYDNCWTNWGVSGASLVVGLDYQGRTIGPGAGTLPGRQITGLASVNLTHADMASGAVTPLIVHRLTIGAVWGVRHTRLVKDPAAVATSGWREF